MLLPIIITIIVIPFTKVHTQIEEQDFNSTRNGTKEEFAIIKNNNQQNWRSMKLLYERDEDNFTSEMPLEQYVVKRRRPGRKRRRRPSQRRPQQLDDSTRDQWNEEIMAAAAEGDSTFPSTSKKVHNRRRLYPKYEEFNNNSSTTTDLKSILKQSKDISLSELLQQKNLTLADLLKGEQDAISILTHHHHHQRQKTSKDVEEEEQANKFIPSHPKLYTSVNYYNHVNNNSSTSAPTTTTTTTTKKSKHLPITLAKLKSLHNTMKLPSNAIKINVNELLAASKLNLTTLINKTETTTNGPIKITINIDKATETKQMNELVEILSDSASRNNLSRLLRTRNMTVEELLEQRERGSSQLHLADIFHHNKSAPFPIFKNRESRQNQFVESTENLPAWRLAYTKLNETEKLEEIENELTEAFNINQIQQLEEEEDDYFLLPSAVRSAIVASSTIISISFFVFITIFMMFKWTQRKRKQTRFNNISKSPILETPYQRRIFDSIVNVTFGRKKKITTISSACNNNHEYLWNNDRKPFQ